MSFQGFAREQGFSNHQINIDINSVINSDLAEANRQAKFMARNAQLQEKWSGMYLNALVKKHEVEKRNREENFKLFMDNREAIQKQIQYNNEVKFEDAGRAKPAPLMETLGPQLMEFATKVGAHYIKQAVAKGKADKIKANKEKTEAAQGAWLSIMGQAKTPEQKAEAREMIKKWADLKKEERLELWNNSSFAKNGYASMEMFGHASQLTKLEREQTAFSKQNVAIDYQNFLASNPTVEVNGAEVKFNTILNEAVNPATRNAVIDLVTEQYRQQSIPTSLNPASLGEVDTAIQSINNQVQQRSSNHYTNHAEADYDRSVATQAQIALNEGGPIAAHKTYFDTTSPGSVIHILGPEGAQKKFIKHAKSMFSSAEFAEVLRTPGLTPDPKPLSEQNSQFARDIREAYQEKLVEEYRGYENLQLEIDMGWKRYELDISRMSQQEARAALTSLTQGQNKEKFLTANKNTQTRITQKLLNQSGQVRTETVLSEGQNAAPNFFTDSERKALTRIHMNDGSSTAVSLASYEEKTLAALQVTANNVFDNAIAERIDDLIVEGTPYKVQEPGIKTQIIRELNNKDSTLATDLRTLLRLETEGPDGKVLFPPRLVNLEKGQGEGELGNGVEGYLKLRGESYPNAVDISKVDYSKLQSWVSGISGGLDDGDMNVQHLIGRYPTGGLVDTMIKRDSAGTLSAGGIYNEAVKYFKEKGVDYTPLPESEYINRREFQQINNSFGPYFKGASKDLQKRILTGGVTPSASMNRSINRSMPIGSSGLNTEFRSLGALTHYHPGNDIDGNHGGPNSHGDWLFKDTATAHYVFDYVTQQKVDGKKIVLTEMGGRTPVGPGHAPNGGHYDKLKFDVPWDQFGSGPITSEDERKYNEVVSHIYDALKYKQQGIPVQQALQQRPITSQQVIPVPAGIGLTPWTPEGNTSAPNPLTETVEWLANFNKGNQ